jgi:hypothetical protein
MGNRAHVIFVSKDEKEISPAVYLHWNGGPETVYPLLAELDRRDVRPDQDYEAARFIAIVAELFDQEYYTGLSLGVHNGPTKITPQALDRYDHGDNGVYVVCRESGGSVRRLRSGRWLTAKEVDQEHRAAMRHRYNTSENPIASIFTKPNETEYHKSA